MCAASSTLGVTPQVAPITKPEDILVMFDLCYICDSFLSVENDIKTVLHGVFVGQYA